MKAVILAGGLGTRLKPFTEVIPKPLLPIGEKSILDTLNMAGTLATEKLLKQFDTDGGPIKIGNQTFTSKGLQDKNYQTPYGMGETSL